MAGKFCVINKGSRRGEQIIYSLNSLPNGSAVYITIDNSYQQLKENCNNLIEQIDKEKLQRNYKSGNIGLTIENIRKEDITIILRLLEEIPEISRVME